MSSPPEQDRRPTAAAAASTNAAAPATGAANAPAATAGAASEAASKRSSAASSAKAKREVGDFVMSPSGTHKVYSVHSREFRVDRHYDLVKIVGYGAYGTVCSAVDARDGSKVAIKRLSDVFDDLVDGRRILREIKVLSALRHPNILRLRDVLRPEDAATMKDVYLVTALLEADLQFIIRSKQRLLDAHVKYFVAQLVRALEYTHAAGVMHRDVKPSNMLVNSTCELVLCDFGLARAADENSLTGYVVTRWYRAPELLVLGHVYSYPVDMWSCGCVLAELLLRRPLFQGSNYLDQLSKVFNVIGTPDRGSDMSHVSDEARRYVAGLPKMPKRPLAELFPVAPAEGIDLVDKLLRFVPGERLTARAALAHPYLHKVKASPPAQPPDARAPLADDDGELTDASLRREMVEAIERFHAFARTAFAPSAAAPAASTTTTTSTTSTTSSSSISHRQRAPAASSASAAAASTSAAAAADPAAKPPPTAVSGAHGSSAREPDAQASRSASRAPPPPPPPTASVPHARGSGDGAARSASSSSGP